MFENFAIEKHLEKLFWMYFLRIALNVIINPLEIVALQYIVSIIGYIIDIFVIFALFAMSKYSKLLKCVAICNVIQLSRIVANKLLMQSLNHPTLIKTLDYLAYILMFVTSILWILALRDFYKADDKLKEKMGKILNISIIGAVGTVIAYILYAINLPFVPRIAMAAIIIPFCIIWMVAEIRLVISIYRAIKIVQ